MSVRRGLCLLAVLAALLLAAVPAMAAEEETYIVKLTDSRCRMAVGEAIPYAGGYRLTGAEEAAVLVERGLAEYAVPNSTVELLEDPRQGEQWALDAMGVREAWETGLDGDGVTVAIIDSGLFTGHEDLSGLRLSEQSRDFITEEGGTDLTDSVGHGTFAVGVIAATRDNGLGIAGMTDKAEILVLRCFDSRTADLARVVSAIAYAVEQGADVINMSFGATAASARILMEDVLAQAAEEGVLLTAAAGNQGTTALYYPAAFDFVAGVGMVGQSGTVSASSQRNESVLVTAPGEKVLGLGTASGGSYRVGSGTSYAAPAVSALAAMAKQAAPHITMTGFTALLRATAEDRGEAGYDTSYGWGLARADTLAAALYRENTITYEPNGGTVTQAGAAAYTVARQEGIPLAEVIRPGWRFTGWYDNSDGTGDPLGTDTLSFDAVGDLTLYAGWEKNTDVTVASVSLHGETAAWVGTDGTILLPANAPAVTQESFTVVTANPDASVSQLTSEDGLCWRFTVTAWDAAADYTVTVTRSPLLRPTALIAQAQGKGVPASLDGETAAVPCTVDVSGWFADVGPDTIYAALSGGSVKWEGSVLTFTPAPEQAEQTVTVSVTAANGSFSSMPVTLRIEVGSLPRCVQVTFQNGTAVYAVAETQNGGTVSLPQPPGQLGWVFLGWYTAAGEPFSVGTVVEDSLTVYARWASAGGSGGSRPAVPVRIYPFADVEEGDWCFAAVTRAWELGLLQGVSADRFVPARTMTRREGWLLLARLDGASPADSGAARRYVMEQAISDGTEPERPLLRQELAVMLWRLDGCPAIGEETLDGFPDGGDVSAYARQAMAWAVERGIFQGDGRGLLCPRAALTRAQAAAVAVRFAEN